MIREGSALAGSRGQPSCLVLSCYLLVRAPLPLSCPCFDGRENKGHPDKAGETGFPAMA